MTKIIHIIHFNDVYNIESRSQEPIGGAARFVKAVKDRANLNPLVFFSGDAFNPSLMSAITKGKQMVPILNNAGVHCAVYGNHDFDFGVDQLVSLAQNCKFPWLLSNVFDVDTDLPLGGGLLYHVMEWQGYKLGLIGLVEEEWMDTLSTVDADDIQVDDFVEAGNEMVAELQKQGVDLIIALTHMRWPNDKKLLENVEGIDLVLGGHDHNYGVEKVRGKYVIKSGTDFREFSVIKIDMSNKMINVEKVQVTSEMAEDEDTKAVVQHYLDQMGTEMDKVVGTVDVDLDGRFCAVRTQETNLGNFVTDVMLRATHADVALLNSGTLRSDRVHPAGDLSMRDLLSILPMVDPLVVIRVTGQQLLDALENGVSQYPKLEGRFPQVSGISFSFDPSSANGSRLIKDSVKILGNSVDVTQNYRMVTKHYMADGKDGYTMLKNCEILIEPFCVMCHGSANFSGKIRPSSKHNHC